MRKLYLLLFTLLFVTTEKSVAQQFTAGNIAVFVAVANANNTTGNIVELTPSTANQTGTTHAIPTTGSSALRFSGSAGTTCYMANSNDGSLLCFDGLNSTTSSGNSNALTARGVGTFNVAGSFNLATTYTGLSGEQPRCATSLNNSTWYIADQSGIYTNAATSPSPSANILDVKSFGGVVYCASGNVVNVVSAATGGSITALTGLSTTAGFADFYLISSGSNGSAYDVLYVVSNTSATAGLVSKFSLVSGSWTASGTYTTNFGGLGIIAQKISGGANLYITGGAGATSATSVIKLTDVAGYNSSISITTANNVTLYTAGASAVLKGIAFAPITPPTLTSNVSSLSGFSYAAGTGPSVAQGFAVTGVGLTPASGNITITGSTNYEVSTSSSTTGFVDVPTTTSLAYTGVAFTNDSVWVRLVSGLTLNPSYTGSIAISGGGATTINVTTSGSVTAGTPSITLNQTGISQISSGSVYQGVSNNQLADFHINVATASTTLNALTFTAGGTFAVGDISNFHLYASSSPTFPGGSPISTFNSSSISNGGTITFSSIGEACAIGDTYFWITADIAPAGVAGNTVVVPVLANSAFTFSSGTFSAASGITVGGTETINATSYYWNGANPQTVGTTNVTANGGTGTWGTAGSWVQPTSPGTAATWTDNYTAVFAGTGGTVALDANRTATSVNFNSTGYTLAGPSSTTVFTLTGAVNLSNNVALTITPYQQLGFISLAGGITGGSGSSITIPGTPSTNTTINTAAVNLIAGNVSVPTINIVSTGGSNTYGIAGFAAKATTITTPIVISSNIINNSVVKTMLGCGSNSALTVSGVISGNSDLMIASKSPQGGTGVVLLTNNNIYTGNTYLNGSNAAYVYQNAGMALQLGTNNALPTTTGLIIAPVSGGGGTFDLNGYNQTVAYITNGVNNNSNQITNSASSLATLTINGSANNTFSLPINGGSNLALALAGSDTTILSGTSTFTGGISIANSAELQMGIANAIANVPVTLNGGTFSTGTSAGFTQTLGTLTLSANSTINLGSSVHALSFVDSHTQIWSGTITITGWQGSYTGTSGTDGQIFVGSNSSGLIISQLAQIQFKDASNNIYSAMILSTGEVVPFVCSAPTISTITPSPASQTVCTTANPINLVVTASGTSGLLYQWYANSANNNTTGTSVGAANGGATNTYTPPNTTVGTTYYYCIVSEGTCTSVSSTETVNVIAPIKPTFSIASNFCSGNAPALPSISNEGIMGTWNPSTVNSSVGGTYIFTPNTGQCGTNDTLVTTINARPTATFTSSPSANSCTSTNLTYTTQSGQSDYLWDIIGTLNTDYIIISGGTSLSDSTVTIQWLTTGSKLVSVSYSNGCPSTPANSTTQVGLLPILTADITPLNQTICPGTSVTNLTVTATGAGVLYQWYSNTINSLVGGTSVGSVNGGQTATYTPQSTTVDTLYYYCIITGTGTCVINSSIARVAVTADTWTGVVSTDWNNVSNWCGEVPTSATDVTIPSGVPSPAISATSYVNNITINNGASLTVSSGTLHIHGTINNSGGTFDATAGSIEMAGTSPQSVGGSMFASSTINNLIDSNTNVATGLSILASSPINITGQLSFDYANAILTTNNVLSLVSNGSTTASVGQIAENGSGTAQATINGNVTVQRYYDAHRRWRLITAPVQSSGAPTISVAWQEGGQSIAGSVSNPAPGFGTDITGPATGSFVQSTGYDQSANNSPSIGHLMAANNWYTIANTISTLVTKYQGYMLFVRGDRSYPIYTTTSSTPATSTILRTTGVLNTGRVAVPVNNGFTVIGNPYPATINFNNVYNQGTTSGALTSNSFSIWDPNIASVDNIATSGTGGWITLSWNGSGYDAAPIPQSFDNVDINGDIQSGAAFAVNGNGSGSVEIDEADKVSDGSDGNVSLFRPVSPTTPIATLRTTLYATDTTHVQTYLADGVLNEFGSSYSDSLDWSKDVQKLFNLTERISILKSSQNLSIERSALPEAGDTVYLSVAGLQQSSYQLVIGTENFIRPDIKAFLVDAFDSTSTPILLGDTSVNVNFTVTTVPGSYTANRFSIIFTATPPATVTYSSVTATAVQNKNINVQWNVMNQTNTKDYVVERSTDGTHFTVIDTTAATPTDESSYTYNWVDTNAVYGTNYYRIYTIGDNSAIQDTSNVASAILDAGIITPPVATAASLVKVYPNPVTNGTINVDLVNLPAGNYKIRIINTSGDILLSESIYYETNGGSIAIPFGQNASKGMYIIEIVDANNNKTKVEFENQ